MFKRNVSRVLFDNFVHVPLLYFPVYFSYNALCFNKSPTTAVINYATEGKGILLDYYKIWLPVSTVVISVIPPHLKIATFATFDIFWMTYLSHKTLS